MMKNFSRFLLLTTLVFSGSFTLPSWAKDCPDIPQNITEITVKSNSATLRKEPKKNSEKGDQILADDKLKVVNHTPTKDLSGIDSYCWYSVSKASNSGKYFIADAGIKEFESFLTSKAQTSTVSSQTQVSPSPTLTARKNTDNKKADQSSSPLSSLSENWPILLIIILVIGFGVIIIINRNNLKSLLSKFDSRYHRSKLGSKLPLPPNLSSQGEEPSTEDIILKSIQRKLQRIEKVLGIQDQKMQVSYNDKNLAKNQDILAIINQKLDRYFDELQQNLKSMERRIDAMEVASANASADFSSPSPENMQQGSYPMNVLPGMNQPEVINRESSSELQDIIKRFNLQRPELFNDFSATPLTLTSDSIQGKVGMNARRIVQLEVPADSSQATYLKFDLDNTSWLIPNIKSPHISKMMSRLKENNENPEIFTISDSGSGALNLEKPAKLKEVGTGLWEIEEPGKFIR